MKRGCINHPKTLDLADRLGVPVYHVTGILTHLWAFVSQYAQDGDLTKYCARVLCRHIGYDGDPERLVSALDDSGFLDRTEDDSIVVHDWSDHCEDSVHLFLARNRMTFWDGECPKTNRLSRRERDEIENDFRGLCAQKAHKKRTRSAQEAHSVRTKSALPMPMPMPMPLPMPLPMPGGCWGDFPAGDSPDSGALTSDTADPQPDPPAAMPEIASVANGEAIPGDGSVNHTTGDPKRPTIDSAQIVFDAWMDAAEKTKSQYGDGLGLVRPRRKLSENQDLLRKIKTRLQDKSWREDWQERLDDVVGMPFCNGVLSDYDIKNGRKPWKMDIDYFVSSHGVLRKIASWKDRNVSKTAQKKEGVYSGEMANDF